MTQLRSVATCWWSSVAGRAASACLCWTPSHPRSRKTPCEPPWPGAPARCLKHELNRWSALLRNPAKCSRARDQPTTRKNMVRILICPCFVLCVLFMPLSGSFYPFQSSRACRRNETPTTTVVCRERYPKRSSSQCAAACNGGQQDAAMGSVCTSSSTSTTTITMCILPLVLQL